MSLGMPREELKKFVGVYRPSLIRPEMIADKDERELRRRRERIHLRHDRAVRAIYADRSLDDAGRWRLWRKACDRRLESLEALRPLEDRCARKSERRIVKMLLESKRLKSAPGKACPACGRA